MTILTMNRKALEKRVGKIDKKVEEMITEMGTPIEEVTSDIVEVEVFPNRPDLLSLENFARALKQFMEKEKVASFKVRNPEKDYKVIVDKSVKEIRPYTVCAIVRGLKMSDERIKDLVEIQEKLHNSIGRQRKKAAIGIYPLDKVALPIRFEGRANEDIKFLPLEAKAEMNARQILKNHPTGREYGKLLEDTDVYPVFVDADGEILSMPPIINSEKTGRVNEKTKDVFIECSGHNLIYLKKVLNILLVSISEMGGKIYEMEVVDKQDGNFISPDLSSEDLVFKISDLEKTLGISLDKKTIKKYFGRMGIGFREEGDKTVAEIPCYRTDILHWIDLAEEIAIAHGFDNFEPEIPEISTIAEEDSFDKTKRMIGNCLAGLGFLECSSFHLTTKKNIKKMHFDFNDFIEVLGSKTERDVLRIDMMTNMLQIISENSDALYPQKIFEMGRVFARDGSLGDGVKESDKLAIAMVDEKMGYTEIKQVVDYLFRMLDIEYRVEEVEDSNYITGRVGKIIVGGNEVGRIGEIAPRVLKNWKIRMPVVSFEVDMGFLE